MLFWAYDDRRGVGRAVADEARSRGHEITRELPWAGYVRTINYGSDWRQSVDALARLGMMGIPSIPDRRFVALYEDKWAQHKLLAEWQPETWLIASADQVPDFPGPVVSKAKGGSASRNVRLVRTAEDAEREAAAAFGPGITLGRGDLQQGYLIWQRFIPGNDGDVRVVRCGDDLFGLTRRNRDDRPFASGSGRTAPILTLDDERHHAAFAMAAMISEALGLRWVCFDFVFDAARPYCLEMSCSWSEPAYVGCPRFTLGLEPTGRTAEDWPGMVVDELERIAP